MELNHLHYFYEVARAGSFTRASKKLRVSQPSISKTIKGLEEHQGVRLFDRGRRMVTLTQAGRRFFESCELIFREVAELTSYVETSRTECTGDLLVGASDNLCNYLLPKLVVEFTRAHPKVTLRLFAGTSEEIKANMASGKVDLGLFYTPPTEPELEQEKLAFVPFVLVSARKLKLAELGPELCVGSRAVDYARPYPALRMLHQLGVRPGRFLETNSQETQKRLVKEGLGYTLVPRHMVQAELARGELQAIATGAKRVGTHLILCRRRGRHLAKPAVLFQELLRERLPPRSTPGTSP